MSEQYVVPAAKPGTQLAGLPAADDIEAMARVETEVAEAKAKADEQKRLAMAAAAAAQPAQPGQQSEAIAQAAEKSGPTVELAQAANATAAPAALSGPALAYAAPPVPAGSDALAAQSAAMQSAGLTIDDAQPASMTIVAAPGTPRDRIDLLISKYAAMYGVPETLVHRVAKRESTYNPRALHRGNYGLMQIRYNTAKSLGYDGAPKGLLDAETNLKYAVKYLRGAWIVAGKDEKAADWLYRTGYYYDAKRKGLLDDIQ